MDEVGDRIELDHCDDPYTNLNPGDQGTVTFIDSLGTVSAKWDSGSTLGLIPGHDKWHTVSRKRDME